ncbi:MAG: DUF6174 domain-containing protein [Ilumatobacteraceae bacterium]|nr:DUF6174 domain-containing protein [Ilumatobacteraceae bacterium]
MTQLLSAHSVGASGNHAGTDDVQTLMRRSPISVILVSLLALAACGEADPTGGSPAAPNSIDPAPTDPTEPTITPTTPITTPITTPSTTPGETPRYDAERMRADLAAARERWTAQNWTSYRYTYTPSCYCDRQEVTVEAIDGHTVDSGGLDWARTIEQWFDEIDAAIGTAADIRVTYDATGAPTSLYIDVEETIADEEFGYELIALEQVTDSLDAFLDDDYGCGYGFAAANAGQTVSMVVGFVDIDWEQGPVAGAYDLADLDGAIHFGVDLMANWCDDVIEEGEPEPLVDETWNIVSGTLEVSPTDNRLATGTFTDVVAVDADGHEHLLGDVEIANGMWGFFAG